MPAHPLAVLEAHQNPNEDADGGHELHLLAVTYQAMTRQFS